MKKTFRRAVVFGLLALAAPFAALPLTKPAATDLQSTTPPPEVLPEPAATPLPVYTAAPLQRSFNASASILICDDGENTSISVQDFLIGTAACELPPDWPDDAILAQMVAAHSYALSLGGAAFSCNSAQCAGWTTAEVLRARWGGALLGGLPRRCVLPQHQRRADRGKPERLADRRAVLTGGVVALGRRRAGV